MIGLKRYCKYSTIVGFVITVIFSLQIAFSENITLGKYQAYALTSTSTNSENLSSVHDQVSKSGLDKSQKFYTVGTGVNPQGLFFNPDDGYLYVANGRDVTVSVIDTRHNNTLLRNVPVNDSVFVLSPCGGATPVGGGCLEDIAFDPTNGHLYVTNEEDSAVSVIDTKNNYTLLPAINVPGIGEPSPLGAALNPKDGHLYVADGDDQIISVFDTHHNNTLLFNIPATRSNLQGSYFIYPESIAFNPSNGYLYLTWCCASSGPNFQGKVISVIDTRHNNTFLKDIKLDMLPQRIAFEPTQGYLYVAGLNSSKVSVIDTRHNNTLLRNILIGVNPSGIAFDPEKGYLYASTGGQEHARDNNRYETGNNTVLVIKTNQ